MHLDRRTFLQSLASGAVLLQYGCGNSDVSGGVALSSRADELPTGPNLHDLPAPDPLVHLLKRTRFGITQADYEHAQQIGIAAYLDEQLQPPTLPDLVELQALARFPTAYLPTTVTLLSPENTVPTVAQDLRNKTLFLALYSPRQLFEVLVDFWGNHFNVPGNVDDLPAYKAQDDIEVIRANVLGDFRTMLHASAKSPAMLKYLSNVSNTKDGPNENYARELMELHTLGREGGYTEADVKEVARCFTGWSINNGLKTFEFVADRHDTGEKTVLGQRIAEGGGVSDGEQVLDLLATHPSTARFIATKLVRRFVSDTPLPAYVERIAAVFTSSAGDIPTVIRALVLDAGFTTHADEKIQRPMEFVAGAIRALAPDVLTYGGPVALEAVTRLGQAPHSWQPPDGFPDSARYWLSATGLLGRWNFAALLAESRNSLGQSYALTLAGASQTATTLVNLLAARLVRRPLRDDDREALIQFAGAGDAGRVLTGAELQDRAELIAGLLLASPYFVLR